MSGAFQRYRPRGPAVLALVISVVVFLMQSVAAWWIELQEQELRLASRRAALRWTQLRGAPIAPTVKNLARIAEERAQLEVDVAELKHVITPDGVLFVSRNHRSPEALYLELLAFRERMSARASSAGIRVSPELGFGFQQFFEAHRIVLPGPDDESLCAHALEQIDQQQQCLEILLETLISAQPVSIDGVAREPVEWPVNTVKDNMPEIFRMNKRMSVAVPEVIDTKGFQFDFSGQTATLRFFLKALAELDHLFAVRSVEVAPRPLRQGKQRAAKTSPFAQLDGHPMRPPQAENEVVPIIDGNESAFTVVIEACTVVGAWRKDWVP